MGKAYISVLRRIAEAVSARLNYDFLCYKGPLMDESYLIQGVAEVLCSVYDLTRYEVQKGEQHPALLEFANDKGRKPELDYLVAKRRRDGYRLAVEAKWAGSSHCTSGKILWDLARLKLMKEKFSDVTCGFLLAGRRYKVDAVLGKGLFKPGTERPLIAENDRLKNFDLRANKDHQVAIDKATASWALSYPGLPIPPVISTRRMESAASAHDKLKYVALCWEIT